MRGQRNKASPEHNWVQGFAGEITVCDRTGIILEMNKKAVQAHKAEGGRYLIGKSLFDCHPEPAAAKLRELLKSPRPNIYTIQKKHIRKLVCQVPWYNRGRYSGFVELLMEIPADIPHFIRE